jgi:ribose transport system permease protein
MANIKKYISEVNKNWGPQLSLLVALATLMIFFGNASEFFFTLSNFSNIGLYMTILGVMAVGATMALIVGCLDVSQYTILALVGASAIVLNRAGVNFYIIIIYCIVAGAALGAVNGFIVTVMKIHPIIGTISSAMVMRGFTYMFTASRTLSVSKESRPAFLAVGRGSLFGIPYSLIITLFVYLIFYVIMNHTKFGRYLFAVGGSGSASYLAGISLRKIRFGALVISGLVAGIGAFLMLSQIASLQPSVGESGMLDVIAAILLGGVSLKGGSGKLTGAILGVIVIVVIQNGMNLLGIQTFWQDIVRGSIIILAVYVNVIRGGGYKY